MKKDALQEAELFIEKVVAPARAARRPDPEQARARADLGRKELEAARRELVEAGLDPARLDKLAAEWSKERKELAEQSRRRAVEASAQAAQHLKDLAPAILPAEPVETLINEMTFIRSFAGQGAVLESNIAPFDNWARYRLESSSASRELPGRLSFFKLWQNPLDTAATVIARANVVVNARLSCEAEGNGTSSWFGVKSTATATVLVRTTVWSMDSSVSTTVHDEIVGSAAARGHFFGDDDSDSIAFSALLPASGVVVAANAFSLIEVELLTQWEELLGSVVLDAEGGSHRMDVPQILLTQIPIAPPTSIMIAASVSYATSPATVTLNWSGALGSVVDIYENGAKGTFTNDGQAKFARGPGTYVFRVCNTGTSQCSTEATVTVTQ